MKSRVLKTGIGTIIFLLLIAAVFTVIQPVYNGVSTVLHKNEQKLLDTLAEKTGLGVSYTSLSPSILTGIHLKGIEVYEIESKKQLLTVQKAVLNYRLYDLLKGNFENAFTGLTITGVDFNFNSAEDKAVLDKITASFSNSGSATSPEASSQKQPAQEAAAGLFPQDVLDTIKHMLFSLPFAIRIKKVNVSYRDENLSLTAGFNTIKLNKKTDGSSLSAQLSGHVSMEVSKETHETAGISFTIDGRLLRDISGSSAICTLIPYTKADYTLSKMEYLLRYDNKELVFRSLMNVKPLNVYGSFNIDTGDVTASLGMTRLRPLSLVRLKKTNDVFRQFAETTVNADASLSYNVLSSLFSWKAKGFVASPEKSMLAGESASFKVSGDNETVNVTSLDAKGSLADVSFSGTYHIPTMQPSGTLSVGKYTLPNGNIVSGDLYFDPLDSGFLCFIPQLFLGDQTLTALQLTVVPKADSIDFSFDMNDYSHADFDTPGDVKIEGSYTMGDHQYLQASVSISNLFLDTVANIASTVMDSSAAPQVKGIASSLAPYIFTNELYISTDFKSVSFNSPYSVIANTQQEKQFLLLSFDGNENSVSVSELNLIYGSQSFRATLEADISTAEQEVLFYSDCMFNSIPYHFSGDFRGGKWLSVTGDYGLSVSATFGEQIDGSVQLASLPFSVNDYIFSLSTDCSFMVPKNNAFTVEIHSLEAEEVSGKISTKPKLALSGRVNQTGFIISSISYADTVSSLDGSGQFLWNINDGIFDSLNAELQVKNELNSEGITFTGNCTNPTHVALDGDHLMNDFYFTADAAITSFPIAHLMGGQLPDDTLSGQVSASGTLKNPYVSLNLDAISMQFNGAPLVAKGNAVLEDGAISVSKLDMDWSGMKVSNTNANFDIASFKGTATADFDLDFGGKTMNAPFIIKAYPLSEEKANGMPVSFGIAFDTESIAGTLLNEPLPVHLLFIKIPGRMNISSSKDLGVSGYVLDDGTMSLKVSDDKPIHLTMEGKTDGPLINFNCTGIYCDLSRLSSLVNSPFFSIYKGVLSGKLLISGLGTDPDMDGSFTLDDFEFNLPDYIPEHFTAQQILCTCNQDEITIPKTDLFIQERKLSVAVKVLLDRWTFGSFEATLLTEQNKGIPVDIKIPLVRMKGDIGLDTTISFADNLLDAQGTVTLQNSEITAMTRSGSTADYSFASSSSSNGNMDMHIALKLVVDEKVKLVLNPLLRGLIAPQTPIEFTMDTTQGTWNLKGDVVLRGGEVSYLNRNFYVKEGRIVLNETQNSFDPNLTLRAETRERDEDGNPVTISLSAIRQNVSRFNPVLSATPAKSETEIYSLLGQIVTADSSKDGQFNVGNLLIAGLDYGVQMTVLRKGEDALRDLCNFDIFSMRTMMLQNALKQGLNMNNNTANTYSFGNYFDNSTVYIGKYFGSSLYADTLLQWTYDGSKYDKDNPVSGIVFQPELGFELSSPFANIRWNFEPNMESFEGSWYDPLVESLVPATSITLSWKFSF